MAAERIAEIRRRTKETDITVKLNLDGTGKCSAETGVGFFDHMLDGFARHGLFDLEVKCEGDLNVDSHHTIEDTGIVLGSAIKEALGEKAGIRRYGNFMLPMDETLVLCALDLSGRPYFCYDVTTTVDRVGEMDTELAKEFFENGPFVNTKVGDISKHVPELSSTEPYLPKYATIDEFHINDCTKQPIN